MENSLALAQETILAPSGLDETHLMQAFSVLLDSAADSGDIYFQLRKQEAWSLEDGIVKEASHDLSQGVGIRAIKGEKSGFAYSDEIVLPALLESCKAARAIARGGQGGAVQGWKCCTGNDLYPSGNPLDSFSESDKVDLLRRLDDLARKQDSRIRQVMLSLAGTHEMVLVANSDGRMAADIRPLVRLYVSVIAEHRGRLEQGSAGGGGRVGYDFFNREDRAHSYVQEAVRTALLNLEAVDAPAGTMDVVLGPGWPGVLLHEAVGHGLEGDFTYKGISAFSGRIGERVASPGITVVDDGTLENRRGSLNIDDEGTTTQCTVLIEDGILKGFMQDRLNARLSKTAPTGNGRRESFAHLPMPRMTNTYMLAGEHEPEEIIRSVDSGFYAVNFGGGQVDITSGKFVFSASEAYLIEKGKVTRPVKGATLIGDGPDVLTRVSMIGNDLRLDDGIGTCGKEGQSVPVGVGQPTLRVDGLTVGGTAG